MNEDDGSQKLGPISLAPGISRLNALTFLFVGLIGICMMAYINFAQPYLFSVNLNIPEGERGRLAGRLVFWSETVLIVLAGMIGAISDRIGRRTVTTIGFLVIGIGYALYPFANSVPQLFLFRTVFAVGSAIILTMLFAIMADYPQNQSRGKLAAAIAMMSGLGIMSIVYMVGDLPVRFVQGGISELQAGRYTFLTVAGICILSAGIVTFGLKGGRPAGTSTQYPLLEFMRIGFGAARNAKIALAFGASFAARADMIVVGTFFSLWLEQVGTGIGLTSGEALARVATLYIVLQGTSLVWAPFLGYVTDRLTRVNAVVFGVTLATAGFMSIGLITDPLSMIMYPATVLLGIGQSSAIVTCEALIGEEAPVENRGSIMGIFSLSGGVGVLAISLGSGVLYDHWSPAGPFVLMGSCNLLILVWALVVRRATA